MRKVVKPVLALRRAYTRRRRPRLLIPLLLIVLLTTAVGVLGYFKVPLPLIPKTPVPPLVELKAEPPSLTPRALALNTQISRTR